MELVPKGTCGDKCKICMAVSWTNIMFLNHEQKMSCLSVEIHHMALTISLSNNKQTQSHDGFKLQTPSNHRVQILKSYEEQVRHFCLVLKEKKIEELREEHHLVLREHIARQTWTVSSTAFDQSFYSFAVYCIAWSCPLWFYSFLKCLAQ